MASTASNQVLVTGLNQADNVSLMEQIAANANNFVRSFNVPGGQVKIFEAPFNNHTVHVRVFQPSGAGQPEISNGWVQ